MYISGIKNRINSIFSLVYYKICYNKRLIIGNGTHFRKSFIINIRENGNIKIGKNCFFNNYCSINSINSISIGDNCIFGEGVKIYDHNHKFSGNNLIKNQGFSSDKIQIGNNCWIGSNVIILKGTRIGDNVVIGAGCIINQNIENDSIVKNDINLKIEKINRRN